MALFSLLFTVVINPFMSLVNAFYALIGILIFIIAYGLIHLVSKRRLELNTKKSIILMNNGKFLFNNLIKTDITVKQIYSELNRKKYRDITEISMVFIDKDQNIILKPKSKLNNFNYLKNKIKRNKRFSL